MSYGGIHKLHGYSRQGGGGVCQMSILLYTKLYLVKWSTNGGGGSKSPKNCPHGLWNTPMSTKVTRVENTI